MSQELISRSRVVCIATAQRGRWLTLIVILLAASHIVAQATLEPIPSAEQSAPQLNVNWLYGILGYEPRYDSCRCSGFWPRTAHALKRNLVTYDRTEKALRPQFASYGGAFASGVVSGTWKPRDRDLVAEGYRAAFVQVGFGFAANWLGEFAPGITRILRRKKAVSKPD